MNEVFLKLLNMSISAGWLVLAVVILRLVLKKAPKWGNVLLWGMVALRLLLPFTPESTVSLIPSAETIPMNIEFNTRPFITSGVPVINNVVNPIIVDSNTPLPGNSVNPLQITVAICSVVWLLGVLAMCVYTFISYILLRRRVRCAVLYRDNIFCSENVLSPFVLGIVKPRIYIPFGLPDDSLEYVIAHEQAHIRRRDHWWKPFGFLLVTLYWFNPVIWLAYVLFCRDIELACDEKVIRGMGSTERADYSQALLDCSVNRRLISACPLAFGEVGVKVRVKSVLHYKKPAFWIILLAVLVCAVTAVCFLTDPVTVRNPWVREYEPGAEDCIGNVDKMLYESISADFAIGADKYGRAVFKDPEKAFETMKELYADGIALIREEQDLGTLSRRNYVLYKKFGWQVTTGTALERDQAAFVTRFLDIYENSFTRDTPDTNPPSPTLEGDSVGGMTVLASHISEEKLSYDELKRQQGQIWQYKTAAISASEIVRFQDKILSVGCSPGDQYVTVQVLHFTEEDIERFTSFFKNFSFILLEVEEPLETMPETMLESIDDEQDLFGIPTAWFYETAWPLAKQLAIEQGLTLDRDTGSIICSENGAYVGVEFYETDRIRHVRIAFYRDAFGSYSTSPSPSNDVPPELLAAAYEKACDMNVGTLVNTPFAIRGSVKKNNLEIIYAAEDRSVYVGILYTRNGAGSEWQPMPETPVTVYEPGQWENGESLIISMDFDYTVPQAVMDWAAALVKEEIDNHNLLSPQSAVFENISYTIEGAKITELKKLAETEIPEEDNCILEVYQLEYRLKPDKPENVPDIAGMVMEDGWITEAVRGAKPLLILHRNNSTDNGDAVYTRISTYNTGALPDETPEETKESYYKASALDIYRGWRKKQEVTFTAIIQDWTVEPYSRILYSLDLNIVEFITSANTERIAELELDWKDMPNGYYIHDPDESITKLVLPEFTNFIFFDWWEQFNGQEDDSYTVNDERWISTRDSHIFFEYLKTYDPYPGMPFIFTATEDTLTIREIFVP